MTEYEPGELVSAVAVQDDRWKAVVLERETGQAATVGKFDRDEWRREMNLAVGLLVAMRRIGYEVEGLTVFHPPGFAAVS